MAPDLHQTRMATAAEPPFHAEIEEVWGRPWGAHGEVGRLRTALVRAPGPALDRIRGDAWNPELGALLEPDSGWYWTREDSLDRERAAAQHQGLVTALRDVFRIAVCGLGRCRSQRPLSLRALNPGAMNAFVTQRSSRSRSSHSCSALGESPVHGPPLPGHEAEAAGRGSPADNATEQQPLN